MVYKKITNNKRSEYRIGLFGKLADKHNYRTHINNDDRQNHSKNE